MACRCFLREQIATIPLPDSRSIFSDSHLDAENGGLEWDSQMLLDHGVETGELLVLVVGVYDGLLD